MKNNICIYCNHLNRQDSKYCTQCGSLLNKYRHVGPRLVMLHGDRHDAVYKLDQKMNTIGRGQDNTIVLNDSQISKNHAVIKLSNNEYWIEDTESRNAIFLNGRKIDNKDRLYHGCLLKMGTTILRFETVRHI